MKSDKTSFASTLSQYKRLIDADIAHYQAKTKKEVIKRYGEPAYLPAQTFFDILARGGKRIRGALTMVGYQMCGGTEQQVVMQAARAIEMIHAYLLIMDDIQDRSLVRRGLPSAHVQLAAYHKVQKLHGEADHFGIALALNAMGFGNHAALEVLAQLPTDVDIVQKLLTLVNRSLLITYHGQTYDLLNEATGAATETEVERVMAYKTAHYSILNPLQMGMTLAGASETDLDAIEPYAIHAGKAFQITDDILGTFGTEQEVGKSPLDDTREGKRTLLSVYALEHISQKDAAFYGKCLGNLRLTAKDFARCQEIITASGALTYANNAARKHLEAARRGLQEQTHRYQLQEVGFLNGLLDYILTRTN
jgi:geranylgeranyl diphosphate synthase type I